MSIKSKNKRVGICVMVGTICIVLAGLWAVLATPETALAHNTGDPHNHGGGGGGSDPGGNVVQQDIPGVLTLDDAESDGLTSDGVESYSDSDAGTTCFIGRRRGIWVRLSKTSDRKMNLTLGAIVASSFDIIQGSETIEIAQGDNPWGDPTGIDLPTQSDGAIALPDGLISQVDLGIAPYQNVSGLSTVGDLDASTWLLFLDDTGNQWGLYFGRGRPVEVEDGWGGARFFTDLEAEPVKVSCLTENKSWTVTSNDNDTLGYLWYRGSKKNAPWVFVGVYNVPWSCIDPGGVESL